MPLTLPANSICGGSQTSAGTEVYDATYHVAYC